MNQIHLGSRSGARLAASALFLGFNLLCGCAVSDATAEPREAAEANNAFAFELHQQLRLQEGNLFYSPYSVSVALTMAAGGARGQTESQMLAALRQDRVGRAIHAAFAALDRDLVALQRKGNVQLHVANSLWPQRGFSFLPEFLSLCRDYYGTSITPLDFAGQTDVARRTINEWVEEKTNRKILELLKPGMLDSSTRLVLANAIYFKGSWAAQFDADLTRPAPFHLPGGGTVQAPLMSHDREFHYGEVPGLQVLELPYAGSDLSMIVLLPRTGEVLAGIESKLNPSNLALWTGNLKSQRVRVFFPKFKMTSEFSLQDALTALGMSDAFDGGRADFSGMNGRTNLFIGVVAHKAFVEVNEEGTEAAAATGLTMRVTGVPVNPPPVPEFRADRPFLFLIRENRSGAVLFLGRVMDPTR